jgi:hypothetical protein
MSDHKGGDDDRDPADIAEDDDGGDDGVPPDKVSLDEVDIKDLLRKAMRPPAEPVNVTRGVQKKVREQTKGLYFADGWSTSTAPRETFLVTSIVMLVVVVVVYLLLGPYGL